MAISTTGYHNQNAIIAKIQTALTSIVADLGYSSTWQVLRANQPTIQAVQNKSIYYDIVSKRRLGVQGTKSVKTQSGWVDATVWYEEFLIQVSGFLQRDPSTDTSSTVSSSDLITMIQGCLNANGVLASKNYFVEDWIQLIRSTELREIDYETDSGLKEKMPQFDFYLVVEQTLTKEIGAVDRIDVDTHPI